MTHDQWMTIQAIHDLLAAQYIVSLITMLILWAILAVIIFREKW